MGRPTDLTPELQQVLCDAVRLGVPLSHACASAEIGLSTVKEWVERGEGTHVTRKATPLYASFAAALKKARADDQARRLARIEQAARGGAVVRCKTTTTTKRDGSTVTVVEETRSEPCWTADAWHLERSDPENWGRDTLIISRLRRLLDEVEKKDAAGTP